MVLRKLLGFVLTTLLTGLILNFFVVIVDGYETLFAGFGLLLIGTAPFILFLGIPVSILSDYKTKYVNEKQRYKNSFLFHVIFGLIIGLVLSYIFEHLLFVLITFISAFLFWIVDEILRKKMFNEQMKS
ncbi:hypothetical protein [Lederbergia graminis]|uniref:Uncharacterized protein n=1 Tax=Lederbergia graminis TaxID=735518 RepID=A0ABW0LGN3_9BACI